MKVEMKGMVLAGFSIKGKGISFGAMLLGVSALSWPTPNSTVKGGRLEMKCRAEQFHLVRKTLITANS